MCACWCRWEISVSRRVWLGPADGRRVRPASGYRVLPYRVLCVSAVQPVRVAATRPGPDEPFGGAEFAPCVSAADRRPGALHFTTFPSHFM